MKTKNALQLMLASLVWGIAFVAQSSASAYIRPFSYNALRCFLGGLTLLPLVLLRQKTNPSQMEAPSGKAHTTAKPYLWLTGGICCGVCLTFGSVLQQIGISQTTVGKAGFITALYIIFVPIAGVLFLHQKMTPPIVASAILGLIGMFLLCIKEDFSIGRGDFFVLLCSFAFTAHILVIDHFSESVDGVLLSCVQFFVVSLLCLPVMLLFERPTLSQIRAARLPIVYAGVMSCGVGYTLQIVGQKGVNPTIASLILSLESVFSALAGWVILGQKLSFREICGCIILFAAILLATAKDFLRSPSVENDRK